MRSAIALVPALLAAWPSAAAGHAIVTVDGDTVAYSSRDTTSQNTLTATAYADRVRLYDPTVDGGIAPGPCDPGEVDAEGFIVEVWCPRAAGTRLRIDVADREDVVEVRESGGATPVPAVVLAGSGSDRVTGGGAGDVVDGGSGEDALDGGDGDDEIRARDGVADRVACGAGADSAVLDAGDAADVSCETVDRQAPPPGSAPPPPPPPPGGAPAEEAPRDAAPPRVDGGALTRQRIGRSRALVVFASASEPGELAAAATVRVGGRRLALRPAHARVGVAGGGARLRLAVPAAEWRVLRRGLARRRRVHAIVTVVATDLAGNSSATRLPRIRLTR
ncbi:MAG TPA: hypothetical protein VF529_07010 [Solirubrobacteraceae bacterium]|jgi:hypothetical protein